MKIVEATENHILEIVELWKELADHHSKIDKIFTRRENGHINFKIFISELIKSKDARVLVALLDSKVIGYIVAKIDRYPPVYNIERYGAVYDMFVIPKYRRMHIGYKLWQEILKWFKLRDLIRVELNIVPKNLEASSFWRKLGFQDYMHKLYLEII